MPKSKPLPDLSKWMTPGQVDTLGRACKGDFASKIVMGQLRAGLLTAYAMKWSTSEGIATPRIDRKPKPIIPTLWEWLQAADFWVTNQVHFKMVGPEKSINIWCSDLRFDPDQIHELFPELSKPAPPAAPATSTDTPPIAPTKKSLPPLPKSLLQEWADLFKKTYPDDITEELATQSVQGMFPRHSITRDRVREILPQRKRGPKRPRN